MKQNKRLPSLLLVATITPLSVSAVAEEATLSQEMETVKITATRQGMEAKEIAHSVTVIDRQQIENQYQTTSNLGEVLAKTVPGMAPASKTLTNYNQSIRGRNLLVLIDGIPQNTNRNVSRDLMNIDVSNIEQIEVLRGGSAVYGSGAAGGVVNIVTRQNEHKATSKIGLKSALSELDSDGLGYRAEQYVGGGDSNFDYNLNLAWESTNSFFDADGDRIAPEPSQGDMSDTDSLSLAGKARWFTDKGTLSLSANHFDAEQDTNYASDPSVAALPAGSVKAQALPGLQLDKQNRTRNTLLNLAWDTDKTPLGSLDAQVYYRDYHARFTPFDGRAFGTWNSLAQSYLDSESIGSRLTFNTDLTKASRLRWGLDMNREKSEMPVTTFDGTAYDNSNGTIFADTGDEVFVPPITQDNIGGFAQLESNLTHDLRWETGARYEYVSASFNDFTTLGQGNQIQGGDISYDDFLFNTGLIYFVNDSTELYGSFSQGFELPDIGLRLRYATPGFNIAGSDLEPIKTDNYEIGLRNYWGDTQTSIAAFYSESDLGQTTIQNLSLALPRSEERIYGVELTVDHQLDDNWKLGGLLTWTEGERYDENDDRWKALNGYRIAPLQLHAYTEYSPNNQWFHRLQVNYSGARDDAFEDQIGFGSNEVDAYTTVDYSARYQVAAHTLSLGIENLFNEDYYTVYGQLLRNGNNQSHVTASGTTVKASYQYQW
ncbi:Ferric aerobactin receptor precursor [Marinomonas gallaica]|uniref:Ferric aerobactin receptor n=1 Tax=Marinomonas gallaica TaxID=1806667 RepID=A0A1C3JQ56_9GAMM|nr:TonB-dependent receptor [Marinomonas gallaica]SBT17247.1 Ferric aerobactin receptor precursor [Marinomonas gallaica]SBT22419.1 Ferric aerobactin receptor precursor [Marinomonas gallaica]